MGVRTWVIGCWRKKSPYIYYAQFAHACFNAPARVLCNVQSRAELRMVTSGRASKVNGGNSGHVGNSGQRKFLQPIGRRRRPRWRESFSTAACSVSYRRRCRRRPIRCKNRNRYAETSYGLCACAYDLAATMFIISIICWVG